MHVRGGGDVVLPGSVKRGWRMSLPSVESVMTSSGAVTSNGERGRKQRRRGRHKAERDTTEKAVTAETEKAGKRGEEQEGGKFVVGQRLILPALRASRTEE